jgi:hypothetical protein
VKSQPPNWNQVLHYTGYISNTGRMPNYLSKQYIGKRCIHKDNSLITCICVDVNYYVGFVRLKQGGWADPKQYYWECDFTIIKL